VRELSLFSGAGGGLLATKHLLGMETIGYVEFEPYCQQVLRQRIKDGFLDQAPIFGDVREFIQSGAAAEYRGFADVVSGGFPCTPFSVAGKQLGANDPRNMWPPTVAVIRAVRPRFAFLENVPGLSATERLTLYGALEEGRIYTLEEWEAIRPIIERQIALPSYFGRVLGDLAEAGYDAEWCVLGASDVGAAHRRKRLWIVAHAVGTDNRRENVGQEDLGPDAERPAGGTR